MAAIMPTVSFSATSVQRRLAEMDENPIDMIPVARPITARQSAAAEPFAVRVGPAWFAPPPPSPLELPDLGRARALLHLLFIVLLGVAAPFGLEFTMALLAGDLGAAPASAPTSAPGVEIDPALALIVWKALQALFTTIIVIALLWIPGIRTANFGVRGNGFFAQIGLGILTATGVYAYLILTTLIIIWFASMPSVQEDLQSRTHFLEAIPHFSLGQSAALALCVAIHEEMLFRGLLLPYLRRVTRSWIVAVVISCGIFGLLHFSQGVVGVLQVTGIGLILAIVFITTRSLLTVIVAHALFDFAQLQFLDLVRQTLEKTASGT